ncbi:MAG: response regulator transcription factor [Candidatus Sulfotelmatobacter sp.]
MTRTIQAGLIEQNPLALSYLLELLQSQHIVVYSSDDLLMGAYSSKQPIAIFIVDIGTMLMPLHNCIRQVQDRFPRSKILLIGDNLSHHQTTLLMQQGVHGFIRYAEVKNLIGNAIRNILSDRLYFSPEVLEQSGAAAIASRAPWESFTRRERRILGLLEQRVTNKQLAALLNISENTIKFHLANIFRKLEVHDRQSAVLASISRRLGGRAEAARGQANAPRPQVAVRPEARKVKTQSA